MDGAISAYLLNPLKGEYPYEDLAKDYMKELIPGAAELLGKIKISDLNAEDERLVFWHATRAIPHCTACR